MRLLKVNLEQRRFRTIQKVTSIRMKVKHFSPVLLQTPKTSLWLTLQTDISLLNNFDSNNIHEILMYIIPDNILIPSLLFIVMAFQNNLQGKQMMFLLQKLRLFSGFCWTFVAIFKSGNDYCVIKLSEVSRSVFQRSILYYITVGSNSEEEIWRVKIVYNCSQFEIKEKS